MEGGNGVTKGPAGDAILRSRMDEPDYLICLQCETPTYQFEFANGKLVSVICNTCGADDLSDFMTEAELEEQS
jgi:hypothetical protein